MRYKTRKENKKQAEEKGKANQTGSAERPSPWFLPQSRSLPSSPVRPSTHKAPRAGRSSSVPSDPKELSRRVRHSVDLELERCRQQAGFPAIREREEPAASESEVDSDVEEQPEPTPQESRQVGVARAALCKKARSSQNPANLLLALAVFLSLSLRSEHPNCYLLVC